MASVYLHWYVFQCSWVQVNKIWAKAHISERCCYIKLVDWSAQQYGIMHDYWANYNPRNVGMFHDPRKWCAGEGRWDPANMIGAWIRRGTSVSYLATVHGRILQTVLSEVIIKIFHWSHSGMLFTHLYWFILLSNIPPRAQNITYHDAFELDYFESSTGMVPFQSQCASARHIWDICSHAV